MAGKVKGIVVEIGGDTSGLQEALKKVNSMTSSLSKELKGINSLLKFDPKNTELLKQKQALLKEEIQATDNKLQNLLFHQEQIAKSGVTLNERQQENYRALQREIILTQNKLKDLQTEASGFTQFGDNAEIPMIIILHAEISEIKEKKYNNRGEMIEKWAADNKIKIIKDISYLQESNYRDQIHINNSGQRVIADIIKQELKLIFKN